MKTAKTCEEYILKTLAEAKEEIELDNEIIDKQFKIISHLMDVFEVLKKYMEKRDTSAGKKLISMNYIFEEFDPEDYRLARDFLFGKDEGSVEKEEEEAE